MCEILPIFCENFFFSLVFLWFMWIKYGARVKRESVRGYVRGSILSYSFHYVASQGNPADHAMRGLTRAEDLQMSSIVTTSQLSKQRKSPLLVYSTRQLVARSIGNLRETRVTWKFVTPSWPWKGGFYKRLVGLFKASKKSIVHAVLSLTQLQTVVTEVEATRNSRQTPYM